MIITKYLKRPIHNLNTLIKKLKFLISLVQGINSWGVMYKEN